MFGLSISATGLQDAGLRMAATSHNIAAFSVEAPVTLNEVTSEAITNGQGVQSFVQTYESTFGVDLVSEMVQLQLARNSYGASAKALKVADEALGTIIDMFDSDHHQN